MEDIVSIVVPVYNVEKYIARCLNSLINQTYKKIEIIVVDDGSEDNSGTLCDEFGQKDDRIQIIHQRNKGLSAARNTGLRYCNGKYVCFIDSDDFVAVEFIECMLSNIKKSEADIIQCKVRAFINESDLNKLLMSNDFCVYSGRDMCHNLLNDVIEGSGVVQNKLYKSELFIRHKFIEGKIHEDEYIVYRLFYESNVAVLESELYYYQSKRPDSITHSEYSIRRLDGVEAARERMLFFKKQNEMKLCDEARAAYCRMILDNICELKHANICEKKQLIKGLKKECLSQLSVLKCSPYISVRSKIGICMRLIKSMCFRI